MELKGKPYLLALVCFHTKLEAQHDIQVCWTAHNNKLTCRGVYVQHTPSQATTWYWYIWELNQPQAQRQLRVSHLQRGHKTQISASLIADIPKRAGATPVRKWQGAHQKEQGWEDCLRDRSDGAKCWRARRGSASSTDEPTAQK